MRAPTAEEQRWIDFQNTWEGADLSNPAHAAALSVQYQRLCGNPDCASAISLQFLLLYGLGPFTGGPFRPNAPTIPRPPRQTISLPKDYYPPVEPCQPESPCPPTPPAAPPAGRPAPQGPTVLPVSPANPVPNAPRTFPRHATDTLGIIQRTNAPPAGYRGGGTFENDGRGGGQVLPRTTANGTPITYREFDVHPYTPGVNRGAERIVVGSDGRAYYTCNHYVTFTEMQ